MGGSSGEYADSAQRVESADGEQQVRQWWTIEHCPHIHGAERPAVIDEDHRAGRRAVLSTRKCVATPVGVRGAVDMWIARGSSVPGCSARSPELARLRATG